MFTYRISPIDDWSITEEVKDPYIVDKIIGALRNLNEEPRGEGYVYRTMMFRDGDYEMFPVYLIKADNNGTTYIFSDYDLDYINGLEVATPYI